MSNLATFDGYIVRLHDDCHDHHQTIQCLCCDHNISAKRIFSKGIKAFSTHDLDQETIQNLNAQDHVHSVEPDYIVQKCSQQVPWGVQRVGALSNTLSQIGSNATFSNVHFFVLDTGVSVKNSDLNVVEALTFVTSEKGATDFDGHGTAAAGLIAGKDNDSSLVGICPGAPIHGYKVLNKDGSGTFSQIMDGLITVMNYMDAHPTTKAVVNMSLGGKVGTTSYNYMDVLVAYLVTNYNVPVVVAAGNSAENASLFSPAHVVEAITVGAYSQTNQLSSYTNYGSYVDILGPGDNLPVLYPKNTSNILSGTSFACPIVAGAVGLYITRNPNYVASNLATDLKNIAQSIDPSVNPAISHSVANTTNTSVYVGTI